MAPTPAALTPAELLQLAGHPLRWRLLAGLAASDRTVSELTGLVGEPQNLVSYHLGKLRKGRLVSSRRSSADGRDSYYRADLTALATMLSDAGSALHPGLRLELPGRTLERRAPTSMLFLCTGNSARSQMAEALARATSDGAIAARSAGSRPKPLHPNTVRVMREIYGIDISAQRSKHLDELADQRFDRVITLCDRVREVCPELPGHPEPTHWSMPDPSEGHADGDLGHSYPAFRDTASELESRIGFLLASLPPSATGSPTDPLEEP